jgi:hypothetical protein
MVLARWRLRRAALRLAAHGWPVTPGAWLRSGRFDCGRPGCPTTACHPALEGWEPAASADPDRVTRWWRYAPHGVLLPTGVAFDVLEVSASLGTLVIGSRQWRGAIRGPVATVPTGQWMFFVRTGEPLLPELAGRLDVLRHARGSWVPAPPTPMAGGPVRWNVPPAAVGWRLPDGYAVQRLLAGCVPGTGAAPGRGGGAGPAAVPTR